MNIRHDGSRLLEVTLDCGREILVVVSDDCGSSGRYLSFDALDGCDADWVREHSRGLAERYDDDTY